MPESRNLKFIEIDDYRVRLTQVVRQAGEKIVNNYCLRKDGDVFDTHDYKGHESSNIDEWARHHVLDAINQYLTEFEGALRFELLPFHQTMYESHSIGRRPKLVLLIDEIEGTTNTKRAASSVFCYRPRALVSIAISYSFNLSDIFASAVYVMDTGEVYSGMRVSDTFMAQINKTSIAADDRRSISNIYDGDKYRRVIVADYSNSYQLECGQLKQALYNQAIRTYGGCRASGMDILDCIRLQTDAYIDARALWSTKNEAGEEKEAMLQTYDIAGIIPIALGCGLVVTDVFGESWEHFKGENPVPLVVARPAIHKSIIKAIKPLVEEWKANPPTKVIAT